MKIHRKTRRTARQCAVPPVIEQPVVIEGRGSTTLYGIDVISNAKGGDFQSGNIENSAVVSSDLAARMHFRKGETIELRGRDRAMKFRIQSIAANQNSEWIGVDIAAVSSFWIFTASSTESKYFWARTRMRQTRKR